MDYDPQADLVRLIELRRTYDAMRRRHEMLLQLQTMLNDLPSFLLQAHVQQASPGDLQRFEEAMIRRAIVLSLMEEQDKPSGPPPVTDEDLAKLRVMTVTKFDEVSDCTVCLEPMLGGKMVIELPCSHRFCKDCGREWLKLHRTCPNCRREVVFCAKTTTAPQPPPPPVLRIEPLEDGHVIPAPPPVRRARLAGANPPPPPQSPLRAPVEIEPLPETPRAGYQRLLLQTGSGLGDSTRRGAAPSRVGRLRSEVSVFRTYESDDDEGPSPRSTTLAPIELMAQRRRTRQLQEQSRAVAARRGQQQDPLPDTTGAQHAPSDARSNSRRSASLRTGLVSRSRETQR